MESEDNAGLKIFRADRKQCPNTHFSREKRKEDLITMFKLLKEADDVTLSIEETMQENEKEFEKEIDNMLAEYKSLNPLINEVKMQQWKIDTMSSNIFDNTVKIDSIEKKVNNIIEYLDKEHKK